MEAAIIVESNDIVVVKAVVEVIIIEGVDVAVEVVVTESVDVAVEVVVEPVVEVAMELAVESAVESAVEPVVELVVEVEIISMENDPRRLIIIGCPLELYSLTIKLLKPLVLFQYKFYWSGDIFVIYRYFIC